MNTIICIGNFDGVHRGHAALLHHAAQHGRVEAWVPAPHPQRLFGSINGLLSGVRQKTALLHAAGAERVHYFNFRKACLLTHVEFEALLHQAQPADTLGGICVGSDFRYGRGRLGDVDSLRRAGFSVHVPDDTRCVDGVRIASQRIRAALLDGDLPHVRALLGRPWVLPGRVIHGRQLGRTLGFPTLNLAPGPLLLPRAGVYAVRVLLEGRVLHGVANFGRRPTLNGTRPLCEAHVFDFDEDLYGRRICVEPVCFLRDERRFDDLASLRDQIAQDVAAARRAAS